MRLALNLSTAFLLVAFGVARADEPAAPDRDAAGKFVGLYRFVSHEENGESRPVEQLAENRVRITPETIAVSDSSQKEIYVAQYTLDPEHDPCRIEMVATGGPEGVRGVKARGLIQADGDRVRIIYAMEEDEAPTEFNTKPGANQNLFVLERVEE